MEDKNNTANYTATNIVILKGLEAVRKRPAMYIGSTDEVGLHHLVWEIVDNAIDECLAGFADHVVIEILNNGETIRVSDNGRGIPTDIHPTENKSALELAATVLHAGGKFDKNTYKVSSGLHGVGLSVVNALSENCTITVKRNGKIYIQSYKKGIPTSNVNIIGETTETGTTVEFTPDKTIFSNTQFVYKTIYNRIRQNAYLNANVKFTLIDWTKGRNEYNFYFQEGLKSYIKYLNFNRQVLQKNIFYTNKNLENVQIEISIQYIDSLQNEEYSFANNILTIDGGTHLTGFRLGLTKAIVSYFSEKATEKDKNLKLTGEDIREGLVAAVSVKLSDPQFEGQTKNKLNNSNAQNLVRKVTEEDFYTFLNENPDDGKAILDKIILSYRARIAAKAARESIIRKNVFEGGGLPGKLADCSSKDPFVSELFIVEGESAGGSAKQGRNREFQAVFPLKGKPINPEKYRIDKILSNEEIVSLVKALGCGVGDKIDLNKLRYHKIIFMADADVDGSHINTLLLTLFFRHLRPLIENGYVYIAQPPLFKIVFSPSESVWVKNDQEKNDLLKSKKLNKEPYIQRFKGLGEMNPEQLWETTMNPKTRTLKQVYIDDAAEANEIFSILMGEEVAPRKTFIETYSKNALLDI